MSKNPDKPSFFERLATLIVDKRNLTFSVHLRRYLFSLFRNWVSVCSDITQYLPAAPRPARG